MKTTSDYERLLDPIGWSILAELQESARIQLAELGRRVGLSNPAVIERVRRMEEAGIIKGYRAEIDHRKVGLPVNAYIRIRINGDYTSRFIAAVRDMREVYECHRITGDDTFLVKVYAASTEELERIVDSFNPYMTTNTMLVLSSPVTRQSIEAPFESQESSRRRPAKPASFPSGRK